MSDLLLMQMTSQLNGKVAYVVALSAALYCLVLATVLTLLSFQFSSAELIIIIIIMVIFKCYFSGELIALSYKKI